jgi:hypothetical protein
MPQGESDDFEQVSRELRERVGGEFRLAAEEDELTTERGGTVRSTGEVHIVWSVS